MSKRREFSRSTQAQIILRATVDGKTYCEGCGVLCKPGEFEIDHTDPDAMQIDKSRKLTADDGKLLCKAVCHKAKTATDKGNIAQAKRREAAHIGAKKQPSKTIQSAGFAPTDKSQKPTRLRPPDKFEGLGPSNLSRRFRSAP